MEGLHSFTKQDIVNEVNSFIHATGAYSFEVVIGFGAAMVMHGLRETTGDLDLDVSKPIYERFVREGRHVRWGLFSNYCDYNSYISLHGDFPSGLQFVEIDGLRVYSLEFLLFAKQRMVEHPARPTLKACMDVRDINAIEARLSKASSEI